jgi:sugar phosphate isomerase/epimerase
MVSIVNGEKSEPEDSPRISSEMRAVLGHVYINMPWSYFPGYRELVLGNAINVEIGFGAEELERVRLTDIIETVRTLRERGCRISAHGPFWDLCPGSIDPGIREVSRLRLHRLFEIMEAISPAQIVCHTGFDPRHHRGHREIWIDNSLAVWEPLVKWAERLKAPLLLENVWEEDPELHLKLFEKIDSPWFGFCLDIGHQNSFSKTALGEWLDATARYLKEIHLHDNDGSFDYHLPVGEGNVDFDLLFGFLDDNGLNPALTLEPHKEEHLYQSLRNLAEMNSFQHFIKPGGGG